MTPRDGTKLKVATALLLLGVYAAPLYWPPAGTAPTPPAPDAGIAQRLFPGVPTWWICARLIGLATALAVLAWATCRSHVGGRRACESDAGDSRRMRYAVLAIGAVWLAVHVPSSLVAVRMADAPDGWHGFQCLEHAAKPGFNLLVNGCHSVQTALFSIVAGAGWLGRYVPLHVVTLQWVYSAWTLVTALLVSRLTARIAGPDAAIVSVAVFLFAPFTLRVPFMTTASFLYALYASALLEAGSVAVVRRSATALVGFGAIGGIAVTCPPLVPLVAASGIAIAWLLRTSPKTPMEDPAVESPVSPIAIGFAIALIACGGFLAGAAILKDVTSIKTYSSASGGWSALEAARYGLVSPARAEGAMNAWSASRLDVAAGLILAPVAIPRTAIRLVADSLLDPIGSALALSGVVFALRSVAGRAVLGILALLLVPGVMSSYDRPSLIRVEAILVPLALLAGLGFDGLMALCAVERRRAFAASVAGLVICGGLVQFHVVNPRVLNRSSLSVALEAIGPPPRGDERAVVLDQIQADETLARVVTETLSEGRLHVWSRRQLTDASNAVPALVFWSPGQEDDMAIQSLICHRWPRARLFEISDSTATVVTLAARLAGDDWQPALAEGRWQPASCDKPLTTEGNRARAVLAVPIPSEFSSESERRASDLRSVALASFAQTELLETLARVLLSFPSDENAYREAAAWAARACAIARGSDPRPCIAWAEAESRLGNARSAVMAARRAKSAAETRGNPELAGEIERKLQRYADAFAR